MDTTDQKQHSSAANAPAHSPGPWTVAQNDDWNTVVIAQGAEVCTVIEHNSGDRHANAALICAAPRLLAALRNLRDWCAGGDIPLDLYDAACAAIAKAEGQS